MLEELTCLSFGTFSFFIVPIITSSFRRVRDLLTQYSTGHHSLTWHIEYCWSLAQSCGMSNSDPLLSQNLWYRRCFAFDFDHGEIYFLRTYHSLFRINLLIRCLANFVVSQFNFQEIVAQMVNYIHCFLVNDLQTQFVTCFNVSLF